MSHQFLPFFGDPGSPPVSPRGRCQYMEQLRRSIEHLRHQTSSASPCSLSTSSCSDYNSKRSISRISDTLGVNTRESPDCMVVYEPYNTHSKSNTPSSSGVSNGCHGYSSSSSGSCSSVDGRRDDTPTNVLEDSGVDLSDTYTRVTPRYTFKNQRGLTDIYEPVKVFPSRSNYDLHERQSENNISPGRLRTFGKVGTQNRSMFQGREGKKKPSYYDSRTVSNIYNSNESHNDQCLGGNGDNSDYEEYVEIVKSVKCPPKNVKHSVGYQHSAKTKCQAGKAVDKSTHTNVSEIGGVCFCAVDVPRPSKKTDVGRAIVNTTQAIEDDGYTYPTCHQTLQKKWECSQKTENSHTVASGGRDHQTSDAFDEIFVDTPEATPSVENVQQDSDTVLVTQSCQTDKSVFTRPKKIINKGAQGKYIQGKHVNTNRKTSDLLRTNLFAIQNPQKAADQGNTIESLNTAFDVFDDREKPYDFVREGSIRSLMSITDTMSVTSMEVANIMAATEESQKSAVTLEKERLRLQHQRLESYQEQLNEEPRTLDDPSNPRDIFNKYCNDESLRKQKIVKSVLENLPIKSPATKTSGKSIHTFVAQSLQSFFTDARSAKTLGSSSNGAFKRNQPKGERSPTEESSNKRGVVSPSLYQLTTAFRLFHVSYGDPRDLHNMRLINCEVRLDQWPASSGSGSSESGTERSSRLPTSSVSPPGVKHSFLVIAELRNCRMEMDEGGIQPGDHVIEMNDACMLNQTPEVFFDHLERTQLVHLVIGRRRHPLTKSNQRKDTHYGDSCML